jgi:hypothetical protein
MTYINIIKKKDSNIVTLSIQNRIPRKAELIIKLNPSEAVYIYNRLRLHLISLNYGTDNYEFSIDCIDVIESYLSSIDVKFTIVKPRFLCCM